MRRERAGSVMLDGLKRLEYRGYDSSGVSTDRRGFGTTRRTGRVRELERALGEELGGKLGISHTRWATHGDVTEAMPTRMSAVINRSHWFTMA